MSRSAILVFLAAVVAFAVAGCGGGSSGIPAALPSLVNGLVKAAALPAPAWTTSPSRAEPPPTRICGGPRDPAIPAVTGGAAIVWARDPAAGPIFSQRIERYLPGGSVQAYSLTDINGPCTWSEDGSNLHAVKQKPIALGDQSRVILVTNLGHANTDNYEVTIRSGNVVMTAVLNVTGEDRALLDHLVTAAWAQMVRGHIVT